MTELAKNKIKKEIKVFEEALKYVKKGYGVDKCKGYAPGCANCQGQILRGSIEDHISLLEFGLK